MANVVTANILPVAMPAIQSPHPGAKYAKMYKYLVVRNVQSMAPQLCTAIFSFRITTCWSRATTVCKRPSSVMSWFAVQNLINKLCLKLFRQTSQLKETPFKPLEIMLQSTQRLRSRISHHWS